MPFIADPLFARLSLTSGGKDIHVILSYVKRIQIKSKLQYTTVKVFILFWG